MSHLLERLKARLLPLPTEIPSSDHQPPLRPAAVLIPVIDRPEGPGVLLTRRSDHLPKHAGQVSFPGGGIDPGDKTPTDGALREAEEEIGLARRFVTPLGAMAPAPTGTGFNIVPIVGLVAPGFTLSADPGEVVEIFEVPLAFLLDPVNHERHFARFDDETPRPYYAIPFEGQVIWGVTAAIIVALAEMMAEPDAQVLPQVTLSQRAWIQAPETARVLAALRADGTDVRFVGGCVRNALLGVPVSDIDIATPDEPEVVIRLLERAAIRVVPTGLSHGTVTAVVDGTPFEITSLRQDVSTDGRRATVAFTRDWAADARRRDFTINAIYAGPDGTLYDPEAGLLDIHLRRVRFIGKAADRIAEDYLRILRFFRFHAWYGKGAPDADGLAACAAAKDGLLRLSAERVAKELLRLLEAPNPVQVLRAMANHSILATVVPEAGPVETVEHLRRVEGLISASPDPRLRLAALLGPAPIKAQALAQRLKLSGEDGARLAALCAAEPRVSAAMEARDIRRLVYRIGRDLFRDRLLLAWSADSKHDDAWRAALDMALAFTPPPFPVTGADVLALGVPAGPRVGQLLAALEAEWIEGDFTLDRATQLARLAVLVRG